MVYESFNIIHGDCIEALKKLSDSSVQVCVTSPPYFNLRDYGTGHWEGGDPNCNHIGKLINSNHNFNYSNGRGSNGEFRTGVCELCGAIRVDNQIGLEDTPEEYIDKLVNVFREVRRVLKDDGTLWVNIGDSYCNSNGFHRSTNQYYRSSSEGAPANDRNLNNLHNCGYKTKDLIGIPWMFAFAMRNDGWYLRQDIIWEKPNPMPESVVDRCTKSHEYIFLFSKSPQYYFDYDAISEDVALKDFIGKPTGKFGGNKYSGSSEFFPGNNNGIYSGKVAIQSEKKRKRDVWTVGVNSYRGAHFATYPIKLIEPCILAGSRVGDTVLDPFSGSGTTGITANLLDRKYIGCELNDDYIKLSIERYENEILHIGNDSTKLVSHSDDEYNMEELW